MIGVEAEIGGSAPYQIELPDFEGPLDLLLHLVKKHELSIVDIPITFITEQYLKMLDSSNRAAAEKGRKARG